MEDSIVAKAIHEAIDKIRTKDRQRPHEGNIIRVAASQCGLAPDQIHKHLILLVKNGVVIERTSKGEDSYYFDADKLASNEDISSAIDLSSNDVSGLEKISTSEDIQKLLRTIRQYNTKPFREIRISADSASD